jgi:hypothetical protein
MSEQAENTDQEFIGLQETYDTVAGILNSLPPRSKLIINHRAFEYVSQSADQRLWFDTTGSYRTARKISQRF